MSTKKVSETRALAFRAAIKIELGRCELLNAEFPSDTAFVRRAIMRGWSVERARAEYRQAASKAVSA